MPIPNAIAAMAEELREWRRDFHAHPELGYRERRTATRVAQLLRDFGLDAVHEGIGKTGVVGAIHGKKGPATSERHAILLRADMDALPIHERNAFAHKSANEGVMHACGHDGHTAMLLGAAKRLAETRAFEGTVYVCFQPAEEALAGARAMIADGLFTRFPCRAVYGMHNWPGYAAGTVLLRAGPVMAATSEFALEITGRGGHAAHPHLTCDPIVAGAQIVTALQSVVSRRLAPGTQAVLSVTRFVGGTASNVIPETVSMSGTIRSFEDETHQALRRALEGIATQFAAGTGVAAEVRWPGAHYPVTENDGAETDRVESAARALLGDDAVIRDGPQTMGGEDFSWMLREKPGCYLFLGNGDGAPLHHPSYDFNDEIAPTGVALFTRIAETALSG